MLHDDAGAGVKVDGLLALGPNVGLERPGADPLADWYRAAQRTIPRVRLVFSNEEAQAAEALLARHLENNVLGDGFTEDSFVLERVHHLALHDPELIGRHLDQVIASLPA